MAKNVLDMVSWFLSIAAFLHLGLIGAFNFNVFDSIFGAGSLITRVIFVIFGLVGLYTLGRLLTYKKK